MVGESSLKNCKPEGKAEKKNLPVLVKGMLGRKIQPGHMEAWGGVQLQNTCCLVAFGWISQEFAFLKPLRPSGSWAVNGEDVMQRRHKLQRHVALTRVEFYGFGIKWCIMWLGLSFSKTFSTGTSGKHSAPAACQAKPQICLHLYLTWPQGS